MKKKIIIISLVVLLVAALIAGYVMHKININPDNNADITVIKTEYIADDGVRFSFSPETNTLTVSGETVEDGDGADYFGGKTELEYWFENTEKIVFSEGITKSRCLFEEFNNVRSVEICSTMKYFSIGELPLLEKYVVHSDCLDYYNDENGVLYSVRYSEHNPEEKYIYLNDIPVNAPITELTISGDVDELHSAKLHKNKNIKKVILDKDFDGVISKGIFDAEGIEFFEAHTENQNYCSDEQGILYNKDKTLIYAIPSTVEELVMPENSEFVYPDDNRFNENIKKITISNISDFFLNFPVYVFKGLEEIVVPENNTEYCSVDGVVFSKDMSEILHYPCMKAAETYEIPSTVSNIYYFGKALNLKNLIISDSVLTISPNAFYDTYGLETVYIGKNAKFNSIDNPYFNCVDYENPFVRCDNLKFITVNDENKYYCSDEQGALYTKDMKHLISVPGGTDLKEFSIPDDVSKTNYGFNNCADLEVINIGRGLEEFFVYATLDAFDIYGLEKCSALREINVSEDNLNFKSIEGVLYSKSGSTLVLYPPSREGYTFIIPQKVNRIEWKAFRLNRFLEKIYIYKEMNEFYSFMDGFLHFARNDNGRLMFDIYYEGEFKETLKDNEKEKYNIYYNSVIPE